MSSVWKKTMVWLGLEDEEPEGALPPGDVAAGPGAGVPGGYEAAAVGTRTDRPATEGYAGTTYTPPGAETAGFEVGSGVRMLPATDSRVQVIEPRGFGDAQEIGERFRQAQPVIVDLEDVERDTARRIVDFASGLTFALRGQIRRIADHAFLLLPAHASIPEDEKDRLRASGYDV